MSSVSSSLPLPAQDTSSMSYITGLLDASLRLSASLDAKNTASLKLRVQVVGSSYTLLKPAFDRFPPSRVVIVKGATPNTTATYELDDEVTPQLLAFASERCLKVAPIAAAALAIFDATAGEDASPVPKKADKLLDAFKAVKLKPSTTAEDAHTHVSSEYVAGLFDAIGEVVIVSPASKKKKETKEENAEDEKISAEEDEVSDEGPSKKIKRAPARDKVNIQVSLPKNFNAVASAIQRSVDGAIIRKAVPGRVVIPPAALESFISRFEGILRSLDLTTARHFIANKGIFKIDAEKENVHTVI